MKPFRELSRRGRLHRLRETARSALAAYGLDDARLSFMQYTANTIYRVDAPGSPTPIKTSPYIPNRYVMRIHTMEDVEAITSELTWLLALNQEAGIPVPAPVVTSAWRAVDHHPHTRHTPRADRLADALAGWAKVPAGTVPETSHRAG